MNESLFKALATFLDAMRLFAVSVIQKYYPDSPWEGEFYSRLNDDKKENWNRAESRGTPPINRIDYSNIANFGIRFKDDIGSEIGRDKVNRLINCLQELRDIRNKCNHFQDLEEEEVERAFSNMKLAAKVLNMDELRTEVISIENELKTAQQQPDPAPAEPAQASQGVAPVDDVENIDIDSPVPAWFNNVMPHYDIRNNELDESIFAANINEVVLGTAPEVYLNPAMFFAKTYITDGLRNISNRVVKAINGEETENRVISLQTGFGGGKTHTLISLYHVVKTGKALMKISACQRLFNAGVTPKFESAAVAVFTNNTVDVVNGRYVEEDNITINTLWGEIAYQLGGIDAYNIVKENDRQRIAPSTIIFKPILAAAQPSLILIDELADYCVKANGKKVGDGTLYTQTLSFIQTLTEAVSETPQSVLIATLPASATEVASTQIGTTILQSLQTRIVRIGSSVKPVDDEEVFEVVRRRLFEQMPDEKFMASVANRYKKMYYDNPAFYPDGAGTAAYAERIRKAYPFHPELIDIFRLRWGSDSKFQRTRGVLRLLASIVQNLWRRRQSLQGSHGLIQSGDLVLNDLSTVTDNITNLQGNQWESVIQADVAGASSNAVKIDEKIGGNLHVTQAVATTLLLASVGAASSRGMTKKQLMLNVMKPKSFRVNDVNSSLSQLEDVAHYLYSSNIGEKSYWFQSKPNINILINQAKANVSSDEVNKAILDSLNASVRMVTNRPKVLVNPTGDVPEQKQLTLVIMHPQYTVEPGADLAYSTKKFITDLALQRGNSSRIYRNTILFLASSSAGQALLRDTIQEGVACKTILNDYAGQLEREQKNEIETRKSENERKTRDALIKAYSIVLKCSPMGEIAVHSLTSFANDFSSQIQHNLLDELIDTEWLINRVGAVLLQRNNLMPQQPDDRIKVKDIYDAFLKNGDKPMITGADAVVDSVNRYCSEGICNVGVYDGDKLVKVYKEQTIPMLSVDDESYSLVHTSVTMPAPGPTPPQPGPGPNPPQPGPGPTPPGPNPNPPATAKEFRTVTISGNVPMENYTQLFPSFVNTLRNNRLKINIKFEASTTAMSPLTENSMLVKSIKESASQLGLDITFQE